MPTRTVDQNAYRKGQNFRTYKGLVIHASMREDLISRLLEEQDYHCAICPTAIDRSAHLDHDHLTNEIRGLLCVSCNTGLGSFRDDPTYLANAIKYLTGVVIEVPDPR